MIYLLLFLAAFLLRVALILITGFDGLYGQDAFAYWNQGIRAADAATKGISLPGEFFWPQGFPVLLGAIVLAIGESVSGTQLTLAALGALAAPITARLAQTLVPSIGRLGAVTAGLVVGLSGQAALSSIAIMSDVPALLWAAASALVLAGAWRRSATGAWLFFAGLLLGAAVVTRWSYALVVPAFVLFGAYEWRRTRRPHLAWFALPVVGGALLVVPQLRASLAEPAGVLHPLLFAWDPLNAFRTDFVVADGAFDFEKPVGLFYAQAFGHPAYVFPLLGLLGFAGAWILWRRHRSAALFLGAWLLVVFMFLAGIPWENFRFGLMFLVPWAVAVGMGVDALADRSRRWAHVLVIVAAIASIGWAFRMNVRFADRMAATKQVVHETEAQLPPDAAIVVFDLTLTYAHYYPQRAPLELYYQNESTLAELLNSTDRVYLLCDPIRIETQWQGRRPAKNLAWIQAETAPAIVDTLHGFTLFQLR